MTLAEVAEKQKRAWESSPALPAVLNTIGAFEADPDYTLRNRVEKLITEVESGSDWSHSTGSSTVLYRDYITRRLREVVEGK